MKLPKLQSINSLPVLYFSADTKSNWGRQENNQMLDHHICLCVDVRTKKEIQRVKGWDRRNNNNNNKKKNDKESGNDVSFLTLMEHSSVETTLHYQN